MKEKKKQDETKESLGQSGRKGVKTSLINWGVQTPDLSTTKVNYEERLSYTARRTTLLNSDEFRKVQIGIQYLNLPILCREFWSAVTKEIKDIISDGNRGLPKDFFVANPELNLLGQPFDPLSNTPRFEEYAAALSMRFRDYLYDSLELLSALASAEVAQQLNGLGDLSLKLKRDFRASLMRSWLQSQAAKFHVNSKLTEYVCYHSRLIVGKNRAGVANVVLPIWLNRFTTYVDYPNIGTDVNGSDLIHDPADYLSVSDSDFPLDIPPAQFWAQLSASQVQGVISARGRDGFSDLLLHKVNYWLDRFRSRYLSNFLEPSHPFLELFGEKLGLLDANFNFPALMAVSDQPPFDYVEFYSRICYGGKAPKPQPTLQGYDSIQDCTPPGFLVNPTQTDPADAYADTWVWAGSQISTAQLSNIELAEWMRLSLTSSVLPGSAEEAVIWGSACGYIGIDVSSDRDRVNRLVSSQVLTPEISRTSLTIKHTQLDFEWDDGVIMRGIVPTSGAMTLDSTVLPGWPNGQVERGLASQLLEAGFSSPGSSPNQPFQGHIGAPVAVANLRKMIGGNVPIFTEASGAVVSAMLDFSDPINPLWYTMPDELKSGLFAPRTIYRALVNEFDPCQCGPAVVCSIGVKDPEDGNLLHGHRNTWSYFVKTGMLRDNAITPSVTAYNASFCSDQQTMEAISYIAIPLGDGFGSSPDEHFARTDIATYAYAWTLGTGPSKGSLVPFKPYVKEEVAALAGRYIVPILGRDWRSALSNTDGYRVMPDGCLLVASPTGIAELDKRSGLYFGLYKPLVAWKEWLPDLVVSRFIRTFDVVNYFVQQANRHYLELPHDKAADFLKLVTLWKLKTVSAPQDVSQLLPSPLRGFKETFVTRDLVGEIRSNDGKGRESRRGGKPNRRSKPDFHKPKEGFIRERASSATKSAGKPEEDGRASGKEVGGLLTEKVEISSPSSGAKPRL